MADIASLSVKLGLVTVEWDAATEKAKRQAKDLKAAFDNLGLGFGKAADMWRQFGSLVSVSAIAALVTQTQAFADEIVDIGKSFDLTTQQVLAFRDALAGAGVNAEGASKILSTLYSKIDEGRQGNDKTIAQFEKLGITYAELKKLDTYEAIQKVAAGFGNVADAFERTKMIKEFFGKGGIGISLEQVNEALAQGTTRYDEYADALQKVGVISDNLKRSMDNLKIAVAQMIAPFSKDGIISINDFHRTLTALVTGGIVAGVLTLGAAFWKLAYAIKAAQAEGALFNLIAAPTNPIGLAIKLLAVGATAIVFFSGDTDNSKKIADMYLKNPAVGDKLAQDARSRLLFTTPEKAKTEAAQPEQNPEVKVKKFQLDLLRQMQEIENQRYQLNLNAAFLGETETQKQKLQLDLQEKILQINAKRNQDLLAAKDNTEDYKKQINAIADQEIKNAQANITAQKKLLDATAERAYMQQKAAMTLHGIEHAGYEEASKAAEANKQDRIAAIYQYGKMLDEQKIAGRLAVERLEYENSLVDLLPLEKQRLLDIYDLEVQIAETTRKAKETGVDVESEVFQQRIESIRAIGNETITLKTINADAQRSFQYGWEQAYISFVDQSTNAALVGAQTFTALTSNMSSAIDNFVRTGKFSFKDFARSIIQDMIAIQMKYQAMALFRMALGSIGFNIPMSPSGGGATSVGLGTGGGYADGGEPPLNKVSLVGERGPELFIPKTAGTVIPNNQLSSVMGGGGQTVNYNGPYIASMSAIDTQSGIQFLAKNKQTIWASYQSANRSVPVSR